MIDAAGSDDRIEQLIGLTKRLTDLLAAEAAAFEARRPQDTSRSAEETARLANVYRHESSRIKADPSLLSQTSSKAREQLIAATRTFEAVLSRHGRALAAAKSVTEGLVLAIAEEIVSARSARSTYSADARAPKADASAITLNKRA